MYETIFNSTIKCLRDSNIQYQFQNLPVPDKCLSFHEVVYIQGFLICPKKRKKGKKKSQEETSKLCK